MPPPVPMKKPPSPLDLSTRRLSVTRKSQDGAQIKTARGHSPARQRKTCLERPCALRNATCGIAAELGEKTPAFNRSLTLGRLGLTSHRLAPRLPLTEWERPMGFLSAFQKKLSTDCSLTAEKFSAMLARFLEKTARGVALQEHAVTLIARSPSMVAVRALIGHADELQRQKIAVRVIFARLAPADILSELSSALNLADPCHPEGAKIRFIKNAALLDAHEQFVLGNDLCWTGDMLRRLEEHRNRLDILDEEKPGAVRLAELSFNALWAAAKPLPARALSGQPLVQPFASVNPLLAAAGLQGSDKIPHFIPGSVFTRH